MKRYKWAGKTVRLKCKPDPDNLNGKEMRIEDYWINLGQGSWMMAQGNPACMKYGMRAGFAGLPTDNKVLYGKVGNIGHLVHESEVECIVKSPGGEG